MLYEVITTFAGQVPMGYVMDSVIAAEPIGTFNINLQNMMFGTMTPEEVAKHLEDMVVALGR